MFVNNAMLVAANERPVFLLPQMASRHGLITGATGTGKTVTVKVLAEAFSDAGVPVFVSDIKGDLTGMSAAGQSTADLQTRIQNLGLLQYGWQFKAFPTIYWDVFAKKGIPVRATISEMGPLLLSRLMDLSAAQEGVLNIIFRIADDQGLLMLDLKDLRAVTQAVGDHASDYKTIYGNIAPASIGAIQRGLLNLESQGANMFFGEPALDIRDWIRCDSMGRGVINVLNCEELFQKPDLYTAYLLWMLSELYETLPEVGDLDKPRMVFFFDEAHLLFKLKSKDLLEKVEQVIRLIRSKGVGVYFITQNPADIPDSVLSQLGNKIQHALRAYTPADQKAVKAAANSFVINPAFKTEDVIPTLGKGEALISFLDEKGAPGMVQRAMILPPQSQMGILDPGMLNQMILSSDMYPKYSQMVDRESAYELLNGIMPNASTLAFTNPAFAGGIMQQPMMGGAGGAVDTASAMGAFGAAGAAGAGSFVAGDGSWFCPNCGNQNTSNFCGNCGSPKPSQQAADPSVQPMAQVQQPGQAPAQSGPVNMTEQYMQKLYGKSQESGSAQTAQVPPQQAAAGGYAQVPPQQAAAGGYAQVPPQQAATGGYAQPPMQYGYQPQPGQPGYGYSGPSLVASVQAQQMAQAAQTQTFTQAQLEKMQKEAVKQAKAELKAEQAANKESDLSKSAKSIATSGARTAVNYLVRGALGSLLKK